MSHRLRRIPPVPKGRSEDLGFKIFTGSPDPPLPCEPQHFSTCFDLFLVLLPLPCAVERTRSWTG